MMTEINCPNCGQVVLREADGTFLNPWDRSRHFDNAHFDKLEKAAEELEIKLAAEAHTND